METSVSRKCLQRKTAQMLERSQFLLQYYNNIASLQDWYSTDHVSHTSPQDGVMSVESTRRRKFRTENRNRPLSGLVVYIEMGAKLSETLGTVEELSTSHDEWTMTEKRKTRKKRKKRKKRAMDPTLHYKMKVTIL